MNGKTRQALLGNDIGVVRRLRLNLKLRLHDVVFAVLDSVTVSPMLLSRNRTVRWFLFEAIARSNYQGLLLSGDGASVFVHHSRDRGPGRELFINGKQDFDKFETALALLRRAGTPPIEHLVDIGANIGTICISAVKRQAVRTALAVEAVPDIVRLLRTNVALNEVADRITVISAAVTARAGETIEIAVNTSNLGDNRIASAAHAAPDADAFAGSVRVTSTTLDALLPDGADNTLIWMDIQGHEGIALLGAGATLARKPPLVLEFCPFLMDQAASFDALKSCVRGYRGFYDLNKPASGLFAIRALDGLSERIGPRGNFTDLLFVP